MNSGSAGDASSMPLASIVVTSCNYGRYLRAALDSALGQDYPHVEVIVVDDGSTDDSADVIRSYGDRILPLFKSRGGQCSAFNAGFRLSSGEYILTLDADDVLSENAVSLHVEHLSRAGRPTKSCGFMELIDAGGRRTGHRFPRRLPRSGDYLEETLSRGLDTITVSMTSAHAWSRTFLESVLPLPENDFIGADGYLTAVDRLFGPLEFIHQPVALYRQHGTNKGPSRFRFSREYMQNRVDRKIYRIRFAEQWIRRLGHDYDAKNFRKLRDWRLILMRHCLDLMQDRDRSVGFTELVTAPFRRRSRRTDVSAGISICLVAVRILPRGPAMQLGRYLLDQTRLGAKRRLPLTSRRVAAAEGSVMRSHRPVPAKDRKKTAGPE